MKYLLLISGLAGLLAVDGQAQNKREIIPRDSVTHKYCYQAVSDSVPSNKAQLHAKLDKWIRQNYNEQESKYTKLGMDGDTYTVHDREALPGKARKFVEYNLTVDVTEPVAKKWTIFRWNAPIAGSSTFYRVRIFNTGSVRSIGIATN